MLVESQVERSEGFERCHMRAAEIAARIERWRAGFDGDYVRWIELFSQSLQLNATPLSIAEVFKRQLEGHPRAWIFTSATLSVRGDFRHYTDDMGLVDGATAAWDSPFDYARQALLYVPRRHAGAEQRGLHAGGGRLLRCRSSAPRVDARSASSRRCARCARRTTC